MADQEIPLWLKWAREIQALSQNGLAYSKTEYDDQRYGRLLEISAEIIDQHSQLEMGDLKELFASQSGYATPKVDVRGAVVRDDKILLVQEKIDNCWCMPGGMG